MAGGAAAAIAGTPPASGSISPHVSQNSALILLA
jgi:hypothetical protein